MKLYYGGGNCSIDTEVRGLEIRYRGAIEIEDLTPDGIYIMAKQNGIMIFSIDGNNIPKNLFNYKGEFKILSIIAADENGEKIPVSVIRAMDYTELIVGNTEDITTPTENLKVTYTAENKVAKTIVDKIYIENLDADSLYLENGDAYTGKYNISLEDVTAMTGNVRNEHSQLLFIKVNDKLVSATKRAVRSKIKPAQKRAIRRR